MSPASVSTVTGRRTPAAASPSISASVVERCPKTLPAGSGHARSTAVMRAASFG